MKLPALLLLLSVALAGGQTFTQRLCSVTNINYGDIMFPTNAPFRTLYQDGIAVLCLNATNWCDRIPASEQTNAVNDLARAGVICGVKGHAWMYHIPNDGIAHADDDRSARTCSICGKTETKTPGEWR